jgi:hypothetical protein
MYKFYVPEFILVNEKVLKQKFVLEGLIANEWFILLVNTLINVINKNIKVFFYSNIDLISKLS